MRENKANYPKCMLTLWIAYWRQLSPVARVGANETRLFASDTLEHTMPCTFVLKYVQMLGRLAKPHTHHLHSGRTNPVTVGVESDEGYGHGNHMEAE